MFHNTNLHPIPRTRTADRAASAWSGARVNRRLDLEMAVLLRTHLRPDFTDAQNWHDLSCRLKDKGFYLKTDGIRVRLYDCHSHVEICTCRFLGFPSALLENRFNSARH